MTSEEWRARYIDRLVRAGLLPEFAEETYEIGKPHDEENSTPEEAADEQMGLQDDPDQDEGW